MASDLHESKAELIVDALNKVFKLYNADSPLLDTTDIMVGTKAPEF